MLAVGRVLRIGHTLSIEDVIRGESSFTRGLLRPDGRRHRDDRQHKAFRVSTCEASFWSRECKCVALSDQCSFNFQRGLVASDVDKLDIEQPSDPMKSHAARELVALEHRTDIHFVTNRMESVIGNDEERGLLPESRVVDGLPNDAHRMVRNRQSLFGSIVLASVRAGFHR